MARHIGSAQRLTKSAVASFPTTGSLVFWVYPTWSQNDNTSHYFLAHPGTSGNFFDCLKFSDNKLYFGWSVSSVDYRVQVAAGTFTLNQNQWNCFVLTWDDTANESILYLNGTQIGSKSTLVAGSWTGTLYLGNNSGSTGAAVARMAEVTVYDRVLSANEVTALSRGVNPFRLDRPVHYWPLFAQHTDEPDYGTGNETLLVFGPTAADGPPVEPLFRAPQSIITDSGPGDEHFANVVLLCHFDGADGATSAEDKSPSAHTLTFNGDAALDTGDKAFGTASLLINTVAGAFVSAPDHADWRLSSANSDEFTVEARIKIESSQALQFIVGQWDTVSNRGWALMMENVLGVSRLNFYWSTTGSDFDAVESLTDALALNTWHAVAADKDSTGKIRVYIDGVMKGSETPSNTAFFNSTAQLRIGQDNNSDRSIDGWIDEVRITKGVARYASDSGYTIATEAFPNKEAEEEEPEEPSSGAMSFFARAFPAPSFREYPNIDYRRFPRS